MSSSILPREVNEFDFASLETLPSVHIKPPRVKCSPIHLECIYYQSIQLPLIASGYTNRIVIGQVIGIHIDDAFVINEKVDVRKLKPIARLGYYEYAIIDNIFEMNKP